MNQLRCIQSKSDIPQDFQESPVGDLLLYHNTKLQHRSYEKAELLIGMCMDHRKRLHIPEKFAYIIRTGGADLRRSELNVSYAIAVGGVKSMALIGHTQCGMVNLEARKEAFIQGLCDHAGWDAEKAAEHFVQDAPQFEIHNETDFILSETKRLSDKYPKVKIAPLLYKVEDNRLYWIDRHS